MSAGGFRIYKLCMRNIAWDCRAFFIRAAWLRQFTFIQLLHSPRSRHCPRGRGILFGVPGVTVYCINNVCTMAMSVDDEISMPACMRVGRVPSPACSARAVCLRVSGNDRFSRRISAGMYGMNWERVREREKEREPDDHSRYFHNIQNVFRGIMLVQKNREGRVKRTE